MLVSNDTGLQAKTGSFAGARAGEAGAAAWKIHPSFINKDRLNMHARAAKEHLYPDGLGVDGLFHLQNNHFEYEFVRQPVTTTLVYVQLGQCAA